MLCRLVAAACGAYAKSSAIYTRSDASSSLMSMTCATRSRVEPSRSIAIAKTPSLKVSRRLVLQRLRMRVHPRAIRRGPTGPGSKAHTVQCWRRLGPAPIRSAHGLDVDRWAVDGREALLRPRADGCWRRRILMWSRGGLLAVRRLVAADRDRGAAPFRRDDYSRSPSVLADREAPAVGRHGLRHDHPAAATEG
jgi:hypothetical protein